MNYRRNGGRMRALTALCVAFAILAVGLGVWAVTGQLRVSKLNARVAELEAALSQPAAQSEAGAAPADYDPEAVAAEFAGGVVTAAEASAEYQTLSAYYEMLGVAPEEYSEEAKTTVLDTLVSQKVLALKAAELGLDQFSDDERAEIEREAEAEFEDSVNYYMDFREEDGESDADARAETIEYLAETGTTVESLAAEITQERIEERLTDYVAAEYSVSDDELRAIYDERLESAELSYAADYTEYEVDVEQDRAVVWNPEGARRVQAIMIPFGMDESIDYLSLSAAVDAGEEEKQAELDALFAALEPDAQEALNRLSAGESFEALMEEYETWGPAEGCCVTPEGSLYGDDFAQAAMALGSVGDVSGVVRTDGGLCIMRYASDIAPGAVPYEQVADSLRSGYDEELKLSQYNAAVEQWIEEANAKYYIDRF